MEASHILSLPPPPNKDHYSWKEKGEQLIVVWSSVLGLGRVLSLLHVQGLEEIFALE